MYNFCNHAPKELAKNRGFCFFFKAIYGVYFKFCLTQGIYWQKTPINFENFPAGGGGRWLPMPPSAYGPAA